MTRYEVIKIKLGWKTEWHVRATGKYVGPYGESTGTWGIFDTEEEATQRIVDLKCGKAL